VDELTGVHTDTNTVRLMSGGPLSYDYLILCTGSRYLMPVQGNEQLRVIDPLRPEALREYASPAPLLAL
jgi:NADPH-dependent 2,4-dienoyl-CoA reductase/sulfur reductase-like enzyme